MKQRTASRIASAVPWGLFGLTVALLVSALVLSLGGGLGWDPVGVLPVAMGFAFVGALVAARTSNRVGWLFLAEGLALALTIGIKDYAARTGGASLPGAPWAGWISMITLNAIFPLLLLALLLFPDGRLPSARWRPVAWATIASGVVGVACVAVSDVNFSSNFPHLTDPMTIVRAASLRGIYDGTLAAGPLIFLACAVSLVARLVRSRGEQRLQLKWFVYATALAATTVAVAAFVLPDPGGAFGAFATLIPIAAGIAILKYRLYDIDVVIRKTVVLGLLAAFITVVYAGIVGGIGAIVGAKSSTTLSFVAAATLAVLFQPARDRARKVADRLVYGKRATPYEVLAEFSDRMSEAYASEDVLARMAHVLQEGTGAESAVVWLRVDDDMRPAAVRPQDAQAPDRLPEDGVEVLHQGELLGALSVAMSPADPMNPAKNKLVRDLASQAGLVLRNVRLIEDLRASRQRLVAAQDEERRKIERNLHDGAQQQLVALQVKLGLAGQLLDRDAPEAPGAIAGLQQDADSALEDLRDLARGIYPPLLADKGLAAALEAQARRAAVPVQVDADGLGRYTRDVESAVYFCVLECLQNIAKYAEASNATVSLVHQDGRLEFAVTDDGKGFDPNTTGYGTGLHGIADRLDAIGGTLEVRSTPGVGTTITGHVSAFAMEMA